MNLISIYCLTLTSYYLAASDGFGEGQQPPLLVKMRDLSKLSSVHKELVNCKLNTNTSTEGANCIFSALGLNSKQSEFLIELSFHNKACKDFLTDDFNTCVNNLDLRNRYICYEMRNEEIKSLECLAKRAKLDNFKAAPIIDCYRQCDFEDIDNIFNCEFECKKIIYNGLELYI
ncbi:hypothetical protein CONCODRAFT_8962 [Conidiobolus coronatus NRRL 28638]|uniref:Uncharacterized protein n=1 Tax=Conidiobolus coronatus (strain ATCC 28846 / CBS 209.66 / NRRL 28638) TaxID=796925 RepID=A0A137P0W4_CONC2|nr:hypothetical protein CONCODRAFT_8962 [Conidiobolus coronatus NRRL 28638]|eukprot:KXN68706.1 hypothetical protein CONCODRAFT_8962 [Conidiobolus coronatus NRRL 28638]